MNDHLMSTYARLPVSFERGEGVWLWDTHGRRHLDALSGIAVCGLGHAHPAVARAVCKQAARLIHTSNLYGIEAQERAAERLCRVAGMDAAFFCNSGAEANEAAIKLARLFGHQRGIQSPTVVVMENSFHGRTLATLTATGNRKVQAGFEPLVQGFSRAPYNDLPALEAIAHNSNEVVAVLVEPIQGEGGIRIPDPGYLSAIRRLCDAHGWLMITDEIQTGIGRTGAWFACQHAQAMPDVITVAKALGNGVPIGACLARGPAAQVFGPGSHGSTFGGNPLACHTAETVIGVIEAEGLCEQAAAMGSRLLDGLRNRLGGLPGVQDIRGLGLMIGIELERPCGGLVSRALNEGLLINVTAGNVIRLLPPLIITEGEADTLLETLQRVLATYLGESPPASRAT
jgi:acetylornithine/N-succinyldiaminopimelate aminotransferase